MASLRWQDQDDLRWIELEGELDHVGSKELAPGLFEAARTCVGPVIGDLARVTSIGSHALRLLLEAHHHLGASGRALQVSGLRPLVRKVFETTGILEAIREFDA